MSTNTRESGNIRLTKTGYQQLIRTTRTAFNAYYAMAYKKALEMHKTLSTIKGRGATLAQLDAFEMWDNGRHTLNLKTGSVTLDSTLIYLIKSELFRGKGGALTVPRKSAFPYFNNTQQEFKVTIADCAHIEFTKSPTGEGLAYWCVREGNNTVREAKSSGAFDVLSDVLGAYKFKRNEGGCWYYIDEYEEHYAHEDGRSAESEISAEFGPLGEQERIRRTESRNDRFRALLARKKPKK